LRTALLLLLLSGAACLCAAEGSAGGADRAEVPLKVFLFAGRSNMVGKRMAEAMQKLMVEQEEETK
jgi:hypothetical protein